MKIAAWNIRGMNHPLKQNGICNLIRVNQIDVIAVLETKCSLGKVQKWVSNKLRGWDFCHNFDLIRGGRILLLWNPDKVKLSLLLAMPQVMHTMVTCRISSISFSISFIYAASSLVNRREAWGNLIDIGTDLTSPWLVLGDFNNVLFPVDRANGREVCPYEVKNFSDCCSALGLVDLNSVGQFFTWSNNSVLSKIDRVLVNQVWLSSALYGLAHFLPAGCLSDHSPSVVSLLSPVFNCKPSFRFYNMWISHVSFFSTVEAAWSSSFRGTKQYVLCSKLRVLKSHLRQLNRKHFSHISERAGQANASLSTAEFSLQSQPHNPEILAQVSSLKHQAWTLNNAERSFLTQKARTQHLLCSDKGTSLFHSMIKRNQKRNFIAAITLPDASVTTSQGQVFSEFLAHFTNLFGSALNLLRADSVVWNNGPVLHNDHHSALIANCTDLEISVALHSIDDSKSPGPDGFSAKFFKVCWNIIGSTVTGAVLEFFRSRSLLKQINHSEIALIPKSSHASYVGDFRPISCCNVVYKLISKILVARIRPLLNDLVDSAQTAFLPGRNMVENIHLIQELLRGYCRKRISPRCIIKIDLQKAFDTISWAFIEDALSALNFPSLFVAWVMECITTTAFSISINGSVNGFFKGKRGLRQGDPLSPYLFILCLEYLSRLIRLRTMDTEFNFHPKCGALKITHLAFADDLMLLCRGDSTSVGILINCLKDFGACSGLHLNVSKSNIFLAGLGADSASTILDSTGLSLGLMPFRYLGFPLAAASLKVLQFAPLFSSISSCLAAWKDHTLSYAGRAELLRSVLQGIQCFWLSIYPLPAVVRAHLTRLCRRFLWGSRNAPVAWSDICLPKSEGGLNIRDLSAWNKALLSKTLWNICSKKDSLWIQWVHHFYLRNDSIWYKVMHSRDSPLFKNILLTRDKLLAVCSNPSIAECLLQKWHGGSIGVVQAHNAYDFFRRHGVTVPWARTVWDPIITPKHSFILWLGLRGRLSTKDRLHYLGIDQTCGLCSCFVESKHHLFFNCSFSARIWSSIRAWIGLRRAMSTLESGVKWLKKECKGSSWLQKSKRVAFASSVYHIWRARNKLIFEHVIPSEQGIIHQIKLHVFTVIYGHYPHIMEF